MTDVTAVAMDADERLHALFSAVGRAWREAGHLDAEDPRTETYLRGFDTVEKIRTRRRMYADCLSHIDDLEATVGCDLGCWLGFSAPILHAVGCRLVYGVEIQARLIEAAEQWRADHAVDGVRFRAMREGTIPLASGSIDWALINQVLCNAIRDSFVPSLRETHRILAPGGWLVICDSNNPYCPDTWTRLEKSYRAAELGATGSLESPDGRNFHERRALIRSAAPELPDEAATRLARETCYLWREEILEAVRAFEATGRTPGRPFDPAARRAPCGVSGAANGNVTDPFAIAADLEAIGFEAPAITVSPIRAAVDNETLSEQLRASQGFYLFARKPGGNRSEGRR